MSSGVMRAKSYIWHRDSMVGMILCFSVVARINIAYDGGSSSVFRNALNAFDESMWTSSIIKTLYRPVVGGISTWSTRLRISSTPLFEAASSSTIFRDRPSLNARHESHSLHGLPLAVGLVQFIVFAKMRAHEVLPTPRDPQNR